MTAVLQYENIILNSELVGIVFMFVNTNISYPPLDLILYNCIYTVVNEILVK